MSDQSESLSVPVSSSPTIDPVGEGEEKGSVVQIYVPGQQVMMVKSDGNNGPNGDNNGALNSSRWTDTETLILLGLWRANFRLIKGKKRNFQEWNMIAKEFNRRVAHCSLGPRTGNQCKVRVKNLTAEYKRTKDQLPNSFGYHDLMKEILESKGKSYDEDETVHINIPTEMPTITGSQPVTVPIPTITTTMKNLRAIAPAPTTPLNAPIASQAGQLPTPTRCCSLRPTPTVQLVTTTTATATAAAKPSQARRVLSDEESSDDESVSEEPMLSSKRTYSASFEPAPRKKPRKNPRPVKMVQSCREDVSLIAILREFLEDSRKREEELFNKILQQQLEAERRYQQFTLDVVKEIGKMFKKD